MTGQQAERAYGAADVMGAVALPAYYAAWRQNPYAQAKPIDPEQLRDVLVTLLGTSVPTATGEPVPLALQVMATAVHKAVGGDNAMIQFVFKEIQHHGIDKTMTVEVPHHIREAVDGILEASGMTNLLTDEQTPTSGYHPTSEPRFATLEHTPASGIATDPPSENPLNLENPFS